MLTRSVLSQRGRQIQGPSWQHDVSCQERHTYCDSAMVCGVLTLVIPVTTCLNSKLPVLFGREGTKEDR